MRAPLPKSVEPHDVTPPLFSILHSPPPFTNSHQLPSKIQKFSRRRSRSLNLPQINHDPGDPLPGRNDPRGDDPVEPVVSRMARLELDPRVHQTALGLLRPVGLDVDVCAVGRAELVPRVDVEV